MTNTHATTIDTPRSARSARAEALASRMEQGLETLTALAATLTDAQWRTPIPKDGRLVGVVVHHVASVLPIEIELYEGAPSCGPLGTKGAGEVPILNVGATVACAVALATGCDLRALPLTPPEVLAAMHSADAPPLDHRHISLVWRQNCRS